MRPVITERASACAFPAAARRGTKYQTDSAYSDSQPRNGASSHASKPPTTSTMVTK